MQGRSQLAVKQLDVFALAISLKVGAQVKVNTDQVRSRFAISLKAGALVNASNVDRRKRHQRYKQQVRTRRQMRLDNGYQRLV